jgi:hypothetical protein
MRRMCFSTVDPKYLSELSDFNGLNGAQRLNGLNGTF